MYITPRLELEGICNLLRSHAVRHVDVMGFCGRAGTALSERADSPNDSASMDGSLRRLWPSCCDCPCLAIILCDFAPRSRGNSRAAAFQRASSEVAGERA